MAETEYILEATNIVKIPWGSCTQRCRLEGQKRRDPWPRG